MIRFRPDFNVVFARINDPAFLERDVHNLGKTFLITVLDFALLCNVTKEHPFRRQQDVFGEFVFFLQVLTNDEQYVTIRRRVVGRRSIAIHVDTEPSENLENLPAPKWTYTSLGVAKARETLDDLANLTVTRPHYTYRKGLGYSLRQQSDYNDVFRISKFSAGPDIHWKPYLATVLGFDQELPCKKYELDSEIAQADKIRQKLEEESGAKSERYEEIQGLIEIDRAKVEQLRAEIDGFSFREIEAEINQDVVGRIEQSISLLNQRRYTLDYELQEIASSLEAEHPFDIDKIQEIFAQVELYLPDAIVRSYEELVDFNRRLSGDRTKRLRTLQRRLRAERKEIEEKLARLDRERTEALAILQDVKTLDKYRSMQARLGQYEQEIFDLRQQLAYLDRVTLVQQQIEDLEQQRTTLVNQIREMVRGENSTFRTIRTTFSTYVESVINARAVLSVSVNQSGNLDFRVRTLDSTAIGRETSEGRGTSYKKALCACFDLAVLSVHAGRSFYRFVYHDGIFEGFDNRKKVSLLQLIRRVCQDKGIQYILTVIDSDLPRDERDQKLLFTEGEIIRELHDGGEEGRLFRMPSF